MMDFWTTSFYIIIMVCVLFAAYFTTKFLSGKSKKFFRSHYISMTDRLTLGKDKNIVLIEVGDQHLLVGVTNQSINVLGEIDGEKLKAVKEQQRENPRKGFGAKLCDIITSAQSAQSNLKKARAAQKSGDDILGRMDDAIQNQRSRMSRNDEDETP